MTALGLRHALLPHAGLQDLLPMAERMVADSLARRAVAVVMAPAAHLHAVRDALGRDGNAVVGIDMDVVGRNPARLLPALLRVLDGHRGVPVDVLSEPVVGETCAERLDEVLIHELLLCLPQFRDRPHRLVCTYDAAAVDPAVAAALDEVHEVATDHLADVVDRIERRRALPLPGRPAGAEFGVDRTTIGALRGFVRDHATDAGLGPQRGDDLVYGVNEAVTNSICHGEGRARVAIWTEPDAVVCEVRDRGWIRDPLAGRVPPRASAPAGRGLWLVNQLCDLVQLHSSPLGTTVRLRVDLGLA